MQKMDRVMNGRTDPWLVLDEAGLLPDFDEIENVLDVGCGSRLRSKLIEPTPKMILGIDLHESYLNDIKSAVPYSVIKYNLNDRLRDDMFLSRSFDIVYAIDVLEHIEYSTALVVIHNMKRIARKAVVVKVPDGHVPQNIDITGYGADELQTHRSTWCTETLESLGFDYIVLPYRMSNVRRHTEIEVDPQIKIIDAIWRRP